MVALYMDMVYEQGKEKEAKELFFLANTKDEVPAERLLPNGKTFTPEVIRVIAEGFNVAVHFSAEDANGAPVEYIEIYHVKGGRILSRERIVHRTGEPTTALSQQVAAPTGPNHE
ncbi:MAG: nuclear transport factor 2 family protein [Advenella sp.]|nr:nuclear transport factor 2 family protein [Advenella sp.]